MIFCSFGLRDGFSLQMYVLGVGKSQKMIYFPENWKCGSDSGYFCYWKMACCAWF